MLSQTLEQTFAKAVKYENMAGLCSAVKTFALGKEVKEPVVYKLKSSIKKKNADDSNLRDEAILDYIVENPNDVAPVFNFDNYDKTGLPFFRSIEQKLCLSDLLKEEF